MKKINSLFNSFFLCGVYIYKYFFSPLFPPSCRFYPSCSEYAIVSLKKHGPWKGLSRSINRILHCHPWNQHRHDSDY